MCVSEQVSVYVYIYIYASTREILFFHRSEFSRSKESLRDVLEKMIDRS